MKELIGLRNKIDEIDCEMAKLFEQRMDVVKEILEYKLNHKLPIYDSVREHEVIKRNVGYIQDEQLRVFYHDYLEMLMELSKAYQESLMEQ